MIKEWSHLPNAEHIDWVIKTLEKDSEVWEAAGNAALGATLVAWSAAFEAAREDAFDAWRYSARDAVGDAMRDSRRAGINAWSDAWVAVAALIAWDDSGKLLDKSIKEVKALVKESNHAAVLLLPAVIVKHKLKDKNT